MTPEARQALQLRQQLSKTSVKKLNAIRDRVSPDWNLRYNYKFYGAHTGRWSGEGVQLQNLPREASTWGGQEVNLRSCFQAPAGYKFVVADLSKIEVRVLAWLTKCSALLSVFERGEDPYKDFASWMYKVAVALLTKEQYQVGKSAVLGCGFQLSGGDLRMDCCGKLYVPVDQIGDEYYGDDYCSCAIFARGDEFKSGLWGYAENMQIHMERSQAHEAVEAYRAKYTEVKDFWYRIEDAAIAAVRQPGVPVYAYGLTWGCVADKVLWVLLPSGRRLHYLNPKLERGKYNRPALSHWTHTQKGWIREQLYGGLITENLVQAIARDILAEGMLRADKAGMTLVGHTHDEIISLEKDDIDDFWLTHLIDCMTRPMPWAPDLPLKAEGYEAKVYRK